MHRRVTSPRVVRPVWLYVGGLALLACLGWVPFMGRSLSPDEGGMLMVGAQWGPGTSLYGDYWVDRPPVLVALFAVADAAGGAWGLRTMGVLAVLASVGLAALVGRLAAPRSWSAPLLTAGAAAALVATPLFGGGAVNGELLGLPFQLGAAAAVLASRTSPRRRTAFGWALLAGVSGACAAMVKQNLLDVFVLVAALVVLQWRPRRGATDVVTRTFAGVALGAIAAAAAAVGLATLRGTEPGPLYEAVVAFRGPATATIVTSATDSTTQRLLGVLGALIGSGAPLLAVVLVRAARRPPVVPPSGPRVPDLRWPAVAVVVWELVAVYLSGSYWLHYLTALVPGVVLLAAAAAQRPALPRRPLTWAYGFVALSAACSVLFAFVHPLERKEDPVIDYLQSRVQPGDTGLVAFGAANILQAAGLDSPYPDLWSLPVRVRDPELERLGRVLLAPDRPTWLITSGRSISTWGVDATEAEDYVERYYERVGSPGRFTVYHRKDHTP